MNDQELLKNVNPSYITGKGCLVMLAGTGDPDAIELSGIIDLSDRSLEMWIRRSY